MLKVLHINTERTWRGGEFQTLYLVRGLAGQGVRSALVCQPGSPLEERAREAQAEVHPVKMRGEWDVAAVLALRRLIRREGFDVVHMHTSHAHTLGVLAARLAGRARTVVTRRVEFSIFRHPFSISGLKYRFGVDRYIAISQAVKRAMVKDGIPAERISVVYSGIDLARFEGVDGRRKLREEFGLDERTPVAGTVAHIAKHKGHEFLVDAAALLKERVPGVKVFIVGDGPREEEIRARAAERGVSDCVVFTGFRSDVPEVMDFLDVFVMPSLKEGLCTSIMDALAMRRAVVGTAVGGIPEIVEDGVTGLLVPPSEGEAIGEAVCRLFGDKELARGMAERGRRKVEAMFSVEAMVKGVRGVYEKLREGVDTGEGMV